MEVPFLDLIHNLDIAEVYCSEVCRYERRDRRLPTMDEQEAALHVERVEDFYSGEEVLL